MNNEITVSVIIPVYNVEPYLIESLNSVIHQTYNELEIIIIDDGSTDESGRICDGFASKDSRITVIHQDNKGLSSARNVGLDNASGDAIVFLDSDDAYHPDFVKAMVNTMIHYDVEIVICRYAVYNTSKEMIPDRNRKKHPIPFLAKGEYDRSDALRALASRTLDSCVWNKIYCSNLWKNIRFPDGHVYEDVDTFYQILALCSKVYVLDKSLYLCRIRPNSITTTFSHQYLSDYLRACDHLEEFISTNIPAIFNLNHLATRRQARLKTMILYYIILKSRGTSSNKQVCDELREGVDILVEEIGTSGFDYKTRIGYQMMRLCPWLLAVVFPVFNKFKKRIRFLKSS